jgi:hypothetical protein
MKADRLIESSAATVALSRPLPPPTAVRIFSLALDVDLYELLIVLIFVSASYMSGLSLVIAD